MDEEKYTYEGLIRRSGDFRTGYVGQFVEHETDDATVFDFLAKPFMELLGESDAMAQKMGEAENPDKLYEEFQVLMGPASMRWTDTTTMPTSGSSFIPPDFPPSRRIPWVPSAAANTSCCTSSGICC